MSVESIFEFSRVVFCAQYGVCNGFSVVPILAGGARGREEGSRGSTAGEPAERKGIGITEGYRGMRAEAERVLDGVAEEEEVEASLEIAGSSDCRSSGACDRRLSRHRRWLHGSRTKLSL